MKKGLVEITLGGEKSWVHPATVEEHQKLGWKVVDPQDLADLAKAGLLDMQADPAPYEKLIKVTKGNKTLSLNMANVQEYVTAGWKVIDQNEACDLVTRGLLVPQEETGLEEKLVTMKMVGENVHSKDGEIIEVHPSAVTAHILAGWKVVEED